LEGVLNVESPRLNAFNTEHQHVLEALATQAVIAIQEAKLLDTIEEVSAHLIDHAPDELFAVLIERACDLLNVDHGVIWEIDHAVPHTLIRRAATAGIPPRYSVPLEGSLLGTAVSTRQPVSSIDLVTDPRVVRPELVQRMQLVSALIVPLITRGSAPQGGVARGAFGVYTLAPRTFSDWDTRLLSSLANHAAIALQQAEALEQLKAAQERQAVAETFAVLGDIAANLLHRVNNLIGVIPVHVQGVLDKRPALQADAYVDHALHEIEDSARATMAAARESMGYLRPLRLQPTSIETCYRTARSRLTVPSNIEVSSAGLEALPPVMAGEEQLRLVLFNLIENAIDAIGDRGGHIAVSGRMIADPIDPARQWIDLAISDNGPGVADGVRDKIFDPDFSTKRSAKKLGFGLWWTKSLVQRFGGRINVNNNLDAGCTFSVRLPPAEERS
ncbi:MAG TPA: GAF domain-containing sensor histidine kinase, partial [Anaerolineae bacterium]|nr:GAF domain-containing sensor histidine kinase [Anaerolineae bacterium]